MTSSHRRPAAPASPVKGLPSPRTELTDSSRAGRTLPDWVLPLLPGFIREEADAIASALRPADEVLSAPALHSMTATRLSFANTLIDRMVRNRWVINLRECEVNADATGYLGYELDIEGRTYSFGVFSNPPMPPDHVSLFRDTQTDFFAAFVDGPLSRARMEREHAEFDRELWHGRTDEKVLGWTIARRSRIFGAVVSALASGRQPDRQLVIDSGGYLIRNGGYYGNGRMGTAAWPAYAQDNDPLSMPYHIDALCLYLWRIASFDFADAAARAVNEAAARLSDDLRRYFGIGNSSGLGTVAALIRWPARLSAMMLSRELAFAYAKSRPGAPAPASVAKLIRLLGRARDSYATAPDPGAGLVEPRLNVAAALDAIARDVADLEPTWRTTIPHRPWSELVERAARHRSREAVELLHGLLLELHPEVDALQRVQQEGAARPLEIVAEMPLEDLRAVIEQEFSWALNVAFAESGSREFFWYRSEENGENRRGERQVDLGVERETLTDIAGIVRRLYDFVTSHPGPTVGHFLLCEPEHMLAVARVQLAATSPYSELQANVIDRGFRASDGIRCFLTLLGLELPTPASARWVRGVFYRGAPLPAEVAAGDGSEWIFPQLPAFDAAERQESVGA